MRRGDAEAFLATLDGAKVRGAKLAYALAHGRRELKAVAREIEEHRKDAYSDDVLAYIRGREELGMEHAAKGKDGQPIQQGNGVKLADPTAYRAALVAYDADHAEAKTKLTAQDDAFAAWLSEDVELKRWAVPAALIPEELSTDEADLYLEVLDSREAVAD